MNYAKELEIKDIVINALNEDIGRKDITTEAIIPKDRFIKAVVLAKQDCVVCGLGIASLVFSLKDKKNKFQSLVREGDFVKKGKILAKISGRARSILIAERVALNFLSHLCGISTKTRRFVNAVKSYKVRIMDTRKTIPGLRLLQKYAVRIGGGFNHRLNLNEMILVKDNHLKVIGCYKRLSSLLKANKNYKIELEAQNIKEFKEALKLKPDIIMLDNMSIKDMKKSVRMRNNLSRNSCHPLPKLEASGGITLKNIKQVASSGVEMISVGDLTHSISSVNISLEIYPDASKPQPVPHNNFFLAGSR